MNLNKYPHSEIEKINDDELIEITSITKDSRVYNYTEFCYGTVMALNRNKELALVLLDDEEKPKWYDFNELKLTFDSPLPAQPDIYGIDKKITYPVVDKLSDAGTRVFRNFSDIVDEDFLIGSDDDNIDLQKFILNFFK